MRLAHVPSSPSLETFLTFPSTFLKETGVLMVTTLLPDAAQPPRRSASRDDFREIQLQIL